MDKQHIYNPRPRTGSPTVDNAHDDDDAMKVAREYLPVVLRARLGQIAAEPARFDRASIRAIVLTAANRLPE